MHRYAVSMPERAIGRLQVLTHMVGGARRGRSDTACPTGSSTTFFGSTSHEECVCNLGFTGPTGADCTRTRRRMSQTVGIGEH